MWLASLSGRLCGTSLDWPEGFITVSRQPCRWLASAHAAVQKLIPSFRPSPQPASKQMSRDVIHHQGATRKKQGGGGMRRKDRRLTAVGNDHAARSLPAITPAASRPPTCVFDTNLAMQSLGSSRSTDHTWQACSMPRAITRRIRTGCRPKKVHGMHAVIKCAPREMGTKNQSRKDERSAPGPPQAPTCQATCAAETDTVAK